MPRRHPGERFVRCGAYDDVRAGKTAILEFGRQIFGKHKVTPECFARMRALFPPAKLVDLVLLMGDYAGTAAMLCAFDMQVPEGKPLLPVP